MSRELPEAAADVTIHTPQVSSVELVALVAALASTAPPAPRPSQPATRTRSAWAAGGGPRSWTAGPWQR